MKVINRSLIKNLIIAVPIILSFLLLSCGSIPKKEEEIEEAMQIKVTGAYSNSDEEDNVNERKIEVYLNDGANLSVVEVSAPEGEDFDTIVYYLNKGIPEKDLYMTIANPDIIDELVLENTTVNVYLNDSYNELEIMEDILFRSSVIKSFTALEYIEYVSFYLNKMPLKASNNVPYGNYAAGDILYDDEFISDLAYYQEVSVYYPNGDALLPVWKELKIGINDTVSEKIIELLMTVSEENPSPAIPAETKVISVNIVDGVCFLNLSEEFLNNNAGASADNLAIYSIVNSLTDLPEISKVQFLINGEKIDVLRGGNYLYDTFEFNHDLLAK